jgi:hypothetical protein
MQSNYQDLSNFACHYTELDFLVNICLLSQGLFACLE